jgi:hypothetical protein
MKHRPTNMALATICGKEIQHDASGQGHDWRWVSVDSISADTQEDIAGAIVDGLESCLVWIADGGQHYRW